MTSSIETVGDVSSDNIVSLKRKINPETSVIENDNHEISSNTTSPNKCKKQDTRTSRDYYFDSYAHHGIHEEMLKDEVRTRTYQMAILQNPHLFKDQIVMDVGCGTGILSMFAVQAGAKHVYAIDCSTIITQAQKVVDKNGFQDKITLIRGKVEEIELDITADIIISEWMGYFLLYESMLDTVLFARDKWLAKCPKTGIPTGKLFPDKAVMYLTAMEDSQLKNERIDFWNNVYGFDMTPLRELAMVEPVVDVAEAKAIVTSTAPILQLDLLTCTKEDLTFSSPFTLRALRNDYIHAFCAYFECGFTQIHKPVGFSTSPFAKYTHWKQTIFYMQNQITICEGEEIEGTISCKPNPNNNRDLDIDVKFNFQGRHMSIEEDRSYHLR